MSWRSISNRSTLGFFREHTSSLRLLVFHGKSRQRKASFLCASFSSIWNLFWLFSESTWKSRNDKWNSLTEFFGSSGTLRTKCSVWSLRSIFVLELLRRTAWKALDKGSKKRIIEPTIFRNSWIRSSFFDFVGLPWSIWLGTGRYVDFSRVRLSKNR